MGEMGVKVWVAMQQSLRAIEAVARLWGRQVGLHAGDVMIVLLLADEARRSAAELSSLTGRRRQQLQRSLMGLERCGVVTPCAVSPNGRVMSWGLTEWGEDVLARLERRMRLWDELVRARIELERVVEDHHEITRALINRPTEAGWGNGLRIPWDMYVDRGLVFLKERVETRAKLEALREVDRVAVEGEVEPAQVRRQLAAEWAAEADRQADAALHRKLWGD